MAFPIFYQRQVEGILVSEFDFDFVRELAPDAEKPVSAIVDAGGQVLYGSAPEAVVQAVRHAGLSAQPTFVDQGNRLHAILRLPMPEGQPPLSWYVVLSVTTEQVGQPVAQLLWHTIVIGLLSALAVTALVFWRARRFVQPLEELQSTMHTIVDRGDLSQRVPAGSADEVGQLGEAFNRMIGQLQVQDDALQAEVAERRRAEDELRAANASLRNTLEALQTTQAQLVQSEKMASLGQLAAGVAHEINNPVGFVKSNIGTLRTYSQNLLSLLDRYEATIGSAELEAARLALAAFRQQIDMDFVRSDLLVLLDESEEGLVRIAKIVADLKDFSHVDRQEIELIDFNVMLDKVINVAWNELKYKAEVIRDYGVLPPLSCFPGRLGQVFMNLLVNAAQAMTDKGEIRIQTAVAGEDLVVEVSDTGSGIAPEILGKIFDPFFTTKPVGRGTGLGLHIAYTIVEAHQGHLGVTSVVGQGTTFTVRLPLGGPRQPAPVVQSVDLAEAAADRL
jgi:signal transduction histidine kinase